VLGKFLKLFKIKNNEQHAVALEAAAGGRLYNVVVTNEKVSKELLNGRCLQYATTFIPLNKIDGRSINPDIVNKLK
jgi:structural maintenance of chromosome 2